MRVPLFSSLRTARTGALGTMAAPEISRAFTLVAIVVMENALTPPLALIARTLRSERELDIVLDIAFEGLRLSASSRTLAATVHELATLARTLAAVRECACLTASAAEALVLHAADAALQRADRLRALLCASAERLCRAAQSADALAELNAAHARELAAAGCGASSLSSQRAATLESTLSTRALDHVEGALAGSAALCCIGRSLADPEALERAVAQLTSCAPPVGHQREAEATRGLSWEQVVEEAARKHGAERAAAPLSAEVLRAEAERLSRAHPTPVRDAGTGAQRPQLETRVPQCPLPASFLTSSRALVGARGAASALAGTTAGRGVAEEANERKRMRVAAVERKPLCANANVNSCQSPREGAPGGSGNGSDDPRRDSISTVTPSRS
ncbi:hypothetical protein T492DRAFT_889036 [Pavlovales sp. CCMP2436]|nr:hypothetical protein T492DRAFT_889036 [Pavlovales sp. CCMP2436]